jgi:hypothetical protein
MEVESPDDWVLPTPKSSTLQAMYWRSEILQVMYWLRGEGFGDLIDAPLIERFLGVDAARGITFLDRLVVEGYLTADGEWYALSDLGLTQGGQEFLDSFSDLMHPAHGECSADCWCHMSADEAEACAVHRTDHDHS